MAAERESGWTQRGCRTRWAAERESGWTKGSCRPRWAARWAAELGYQDVGARLFLGNAGGRQWSRNEADGESRDGGGGSRNGSSGSDGSASGDTCEWWRSVHGANDALERAQTRGLRYRAELRQ